MDFVFDLYQQGKINEANSVAQKAVTKAERFEYRIDELQKQVERLTLVSQAIWELLKDSGFADEERLLKKIEEVDLRDGRSDGKVTPTVKVCSRCQRNSNSKRLGCVYCGEPLADLNVYEGR